MESSYHNIGGWFDVMGAVFLLVLVYLIVTNGTQVNKLVSTLAGDSLKGIVVLQGRSTKSAGV